MREIFADVTLGEWLQALAIGLTLAALGYVCLFLFLALE